MSINRRNFLKGSYSEQELCCLLLQELHHTKT